MSAVSQMQVTFFTEETAPHGPVLSALGTRGYAAHHFNLVGWWREHDGQLLLSEEERKARRQYRYSMPGGIRDGESYVPDYQLHPPCAKCDWARVQTNPQAAAARREIKRRLREFQKTGKFPPGWLAPTTSKFGGARMSDKEALRVVLPIFPRNYSPIERVGKKGKWKFREEWLGEEYITGNVARRYLDLVNRARPKVYQAEKDTSSRALRWRCGCTLEQVMNTENRNRWVDHTMKPCLKHKPAISGDAADD